MGMSFTLCIAGVILVLQPELLFNGKMYESNNSTATDYRFGNETSTITNNNSNLVTVILGYVLSLVAGLPVPANVLLTQKHPYLLEHITKVLFWAYILGALLSAILLTIFETPTLPQNRFDILMVKGHYVGYVFR